MAVIPLWTPEPAVAGPDVLTGTRRPVGSELMSADLLVGAGGSEASTCAPGLRRTQVGRLPGYQRSPAHGQSRSASPRPPTQLPLRNRPRSPGERTVRYACTPCEPSAGMLNVVDSRTAGARRATISGLLGRQWVMILPVTSRGRSSTSNSIPIWNESRKGVFVLVAICDSSPQPVRGARGPATRPGHGPRPRSPGPRGRRPGRRSPPARRQGPRAEWLPAPAGRPGPTPPSPRRR